MVRNKLDPCIFCGEAPCVCNAPAKPVPKKRVQPVPVESEVAPVAIEQPGPPAPPQRKPSFKEAMKAAAAAAPPRPVDPPPPPKPVRKQREVNEADALFAAAVRALAPLLAPYEREKYRVIITSTPGPEERKVVWKARRRESESVHPE